MATDTTKQGIGDLLKGVLEIIRDADPNAISDTTEAKVVMYANLVGGALDPMLAKVGDGSVIPTIIDASSNILTQVDRIWDASVANKAATATAAIPVSTVNSTATPVKA